VCGATAMGADVMEKVTFIYTYRYIFVHMHLCVYTYVYVHENKYTNSISEGNL
jgi:hypothetical protein